MSRAAVSAGGIKIKKGKLRGVDSCGMMCSIEELGSSRDMYPEAPEERHLHFPGGYRSRRQTRWKCWDLNDVVFEYEVTSNRVDCFSVVGIAREAAATFRKDIPSAGCHRDGQCGECRLTISR